MSENVGYAVHVSFELAFEGNGLRRGYTVVG
jgi:hypothetical protein